MLTDAACRKAIWARGGIANGFKIGPLAPPLIRLPPPSPRKRGEARLPFWFRQSPRSPSLRPASFSPFTGRSARQGDEGQRQRFKIYHRRYQPRRRCLLLPVHRV